MTMKKKKIVSVIQQKGGVGKTTLAVHLAHELKHQYPSIKVVIADADPQGSASAWIERGVKRGHKHGVSVVKVASDGIGQKLRGELNDIDADITIIDLPPAVESVSLRAALYSDLMLVPVGASALDLDAMRAVVNVCEEAISSNSDKKFLIIPSKLQTTTSAGKELRNVLKKWGPVAKGSIGHRVSYADAALHGEGVTTFAAGSPAHKEIKEIANEASKILGLK